MPKRTDLKHILVIGSGPGSFTGLRIGFSFMKGLAFALRVPLVAVSSLLGCAAGAEDGRSLIAASADARRGERFCAIFRRAPNGRLTQILPDCILPQAALPLELERCRAAMGAAREDVLWIDPAPQTGPSGEYAPEAPRRSAAGLLAAVEMTDIKPQPYAPDVLAALEPNYLRAVAAKSIAERAASEVDKKEGID